MFTIWFDHAWNCLIFWTHFRNQRKLDLFRPRRSLEFVAVQILEKLRRTISGKQFVVITTAWCGKFIRVVTTMTNTSTEVTNTFFTNFLIPLAVPDIILSGNWKQFMSTFCPSICIYLGARKCKNTAYHFKLRGQWNDKAGLLYHDSDCMSPSNN